MKKRTYINNISVWDYFNSQDAESYRGVLKHIAPKNEFSGNSFSMEVCTYRDIRTIEKLLSTGKTVAEMCEVFKIAFKISEQDFYKAGVIEFFEAQNYLVQILEQIGKAESGIVSGVKINKEAWKTAGGDRLKPFGQMMPLIKLGKIYGIYPFDLELKPYAEILNLVALHSIEDEVNRNYQELTKPTQKKP